MVGILDLLVPFARDQVGSVALGEKGQRRVEGAAIGADADDSAAAEEPPAVADENGEPAD